MRRLLNGLVLDGLDGREWSIEKGVRRDGLVRVCNESSVLMIGAFLCR